MKIAGLVTAIAMLWGAIFFWLPGIDFVVGDGVISGRASEDVAVAPKSKCIRRSEKIVAASVADFRTKVVENGLGDNVHGSVKFFSRFDRENFHDGYFNELDISKLKPGFKAYVMGHYQSLYPRRPYDYVVCVYDPDGNVAGAPTGYSASFVPEDQDWWYAINFWAEDVLNRPGIWWMEVILTDTTNGRRLVLSRNLSVSD